MPRYVVKIKLSGWVDIAVTATDEVAAAKLAERLAPFQPEDWPSLDAETEDVRMVGP